MLRLTIDDRLGAKQNNYPPEAAYVPQLAVSAKKSCAIMKYVRGNFADIFLLSFGDRKDRMIGKGSCMPKDGCFRNPEMRKS